ncbi:non-specific lipid-transfer protein-like protein At5g64080 [Phalaenopsis equestris]|uniref:non-specific lipid-transfer protein-like protein At5g64080 n=1 Tax=Phalaenopsis equestris TaxID=78828 RepID=UPI0009E205D0|nr:non-specific lipid-transfer protein-like protein At5g64080 [Phalaenopsis equestris]
MALNGYQLTLFAFLLSTLFAGSAAQSSSSSCTSALLSLSTCLNFISGNAMTPPSSCCSQLNSVVNSEPQCLCAVLNGDAASGLGISINTTKALALPTACKVHTPPISQCSTSSSPPSTGTTPSTSNSPSGGGTKNVPSTDTGAANRFNADVYVRLLLSLLLALLFSSA